MLFGPEESQRLWDPPVDGSKTVEAGVAAGADGDEQIRITVSRLPMVNMQDAGVPCPATPALKSVPNQDSFPVPAEVIPRVPAHPITLRTQAGYGWDSFAAGAEQRSLAEGRVRVSPQEEFRTTAEG